MSGANLMDPFRFTSPAFTLIQKALSSRSTGTTVAATFASTPVEGNLLVACLGTDGATFNTPAGWTAAVTQTLTKVNGGIFYRVAGAGESKTVTFDGLTAGIAILSILEYSGATATPLDKTASNDEGTNQTAISSGTTATTAQAEELAVALVGFDKNAGNSVSWSNGFVEQHSSMDPVGLPDESSIGVAHKLLSATGAQETTWTIGGSASKGSGYIATFKGV